MCSKRVLRSFEEKVRTRCDPNSLCICKGVRISSENVSENIACTGALFELTLLTDTATFRKKRAGLTNGYSGY